MASLVAELVALALLSVAARSSGEGCSHSDGWEAKSVDKRLDDATLVLEGYFKDKWEEGDKTYVNMDVYCVIKNTANVEVPGNLTVWQVSATCPSQTVDLLTEPYTYLFLLKPAEAGFVFDTVNEEAAVLDVTVSSLGDRCDFREADRPTNPLPEAACPTIDTSKSCKTSSDEGCSHSDGWEAKPVDKRLDDATLVLEGYFKEEWVEGSKTYVNMDVYCILKNTANVEVPGNLTVSQDSATCPAQTVDLLTEPATHLFLLKPSLGEIVFDTVNEEAAVLGETVSRLGDRCDFREAVLPTNPVEGAACPTPDTSKSCKTSSAHALWSTNHVWALVASLACLRLFA